MLKNYESDSDILACNDIRLQYIDILTYSESKSMLAIFKMPSK